MKAIGFALMLMGSIAITACGGSDSNRDGAADSSIVTDSNILMDTMPSDSTVMDTSIIDTGVLEPEP